jgi:serine/threonine protein kinase
MKKCTQCENTYSNSHVYCPQDGVALVLVEGLRPGTIIQRKYRITEQIGSGGMGVVYRAHHILLKEDYALSTLAIPTSFNGSSRKP